MKDDVAMDSNEICPPQASTDTEIEFNFAGLERPEVADRLWALNLLLCKEKQKRKE